MTVSDKTLGMNARELMEATEAEGQMALQDRIIQETAEVRARGRPSTNRYTTLGPLQTHESY